MSLKHCCQIVFNILQYIYKLSCLVFLIRSSPKSNFVDFFTVTSVDYCTIQLTICELLYNTVDNLCAPVPYSWQFVSSCTIQLPICALLYNTIDNLWAPVQYSWQFVSSCTIQLTICELLYNTVGNLCASVWAFCPQNIFSSPQVVL